MHKFDPHLFIFLFDQLFGFKANQPVDSAAVVNRTVRVSIDTRPSIIKASSTTPKFAIRVTTKPITGGSPLYHSHSESSWS